MLLNRDFIKRYGISGNGLKLLALIFMITDHVGAVLLPQYRILRYIGRLAFPLYCFLVTEGVHYTRNIYNYGLRLLAFAVISEVPFDLAIHGKVLEFQDQNVFFTLFIGMAVVYVASIMPDMSKGFAVCLAGMGAALLLRTDYSSYGVLMIYCFHIFRHKPLSMTIYIGLINFVMGMGGTGSQKYAVLAMIPILLYSGKQYYSSGSKGKWQPLVKYLFYVAYPLHLIILWWVSKI